ncbi:hypothetical protein EV715DRAFT_297692 [Schizophyllum commune]
MSTAPCGHRGAGERIPSSAPTYSDEYGFPRRTVAILFVTAFLSAGLAAPWVSPWADIYGRKRVYLILCVSSSSHPPSQYYSPRGEMIRCQYGGSSGILGRATLANGFVANAAADQLEQIDTTSAEAMHSGHGANPSPSMASSGLMSSALVAILATWSANYGGAVRAAPSNEVQKLAHARKLGRQVPIILPLGPTQTSMYLLVPLWVPASRERATSRSPAPSFHQLSAASATWTQT